LIECVCDALDSLSCSLSTRIQRRTLIDVQCMV